MDVRHVLILKTAHHVDEAIHLGELVEQRAGDAGFTGAAIQPGDIGIGHLGVDGLFGLEHGGEPVHARVGHIHHGGVHFDLARGDAGGLACRG